MKQLLSVILVASICLAIVTRISAYLPSSAAIAATARLGYSRRGLIVRDKNNQASIAMLSKSSSRNNPVIEKKVLGKKGSDIPQKMIQLLEKMISKRMFPGSMDFRYDSVQIEEKIKKYRIDLSIPHSGTGYLLLRIAIAGGRRDVCRLLIKHGASQLAVDSKGETFIY